MSERPSPVQKITAWFSALNKREQRLIIGTVFFVPLFLFSQLIYLPGYDRQRQLQKQFHQLQQDNVLLQTQVLETTLLAEQDPDAANRKKLEQLQQEISRFDAQLQQQLSGLVAPAQMPDLLRSMLKKRPGLTLVHMENAQPEILSLAPLDPKNPEQTAAPLAEVVLYRHPLHLELKGSYLELLAYLRTLNSLPQRIFWQNLQIEMTDHYPQARINVDVYTLSLEKGWISG